MCRLLGMNNKVRIIWIFFILLFLGLFLGDGKQSVGDIYGISVVLVVWMYYRISTGVRSYRALPPIIAWLWIVTFASALISTIGSDSLGFSLSWLVRLSAGHLVFLLFYSVSDTAMSRRFYVVALGFVGAAAVSGMILRFFGLFSSLLPSMNLLDVRHGHSHLADLLVFIVPLVLALRRVVRISAWQYAGVVFLLFGLLVVTFARGAWLVVGLYLIYESFCFIRSVRVRRALLFSGLTICVFVIVSQFGSKYVHVPGALRSIIRKETTTARFEYWRQAWVAFSERPIVGRGPGTFSLQSLRLQKGPGQSSWFAHSFLLQTLAETGILGFMSQLVLLGAIAALILRINFQSDSKTHIIHRAVLLGAILLFAYGTIEFVLDYYATWLLFWGTLGWLMGQSTGKISVNRLGVGPYIPFFYIATYYALWIGSQMIMLMNDRYDISFYVAPFDTVNTVAFFSNINRSVGINDYYVVRLFHRNNPTILRELAGNYSKYGDNARAKELYLRSIDLDPKNIESYELYFNSSQVIGYPYTSDEKIRFLSQKALSRNIAQKTADAFEKHPPRLNAEQKKIIFTGSYEEILARSYYWIGLLMLDQNPSGTLYWWQLARIVDPGVSYYSVEVASLYIDAFYNNNAAKNILYICSQNKYAGKHCGDALKVVGQNWTDTPGTYQDKILPLLGVSVAR